MKKQYIGMMLSISLVSQPAMAAHLSVMSWKGAETAETEWNDRIYKIDDKGKKNISQLSRAVLQGDGADVQQILNRDKNANEVDSYGVTPLHLAALKGQNQILDILLENGAKIDARDKYGRTPLMYAILQGNQGTVDRLLKYKPDLNVVDNLGRTALHWAVSKAKFKITDALIDGGANVRAVDNEGNTALHYAASIRYMFGREKETGFSNMDGRFIAAGAIAGVGIAVMMASSATAGLTLAAASVGMAAIAATAIAGGSIGAGVGAFFTTLGVTGLATTGGAIAGGALAGGVTTAAALGTLLGAVILVIAVIVGLVFASMAIDKALDKHNDQVRRHEIHGQRDKIIKRLLEKDNTLAIIANKEGRIPSHFAALAGNKAPQELMSERMGSNAAALWSTVDHNGLTPLMCAIMGSHEDNNIKIIGLEDTLVSKGFADSSNTTALGTLVTTKTGQQVKFLNRNNITPLKFSLMFRDSKKFGDILKVVGDQDTYADVEGRNILHYAAIEGSHIKKVYETYNNVPWHKIDRNKIKFNGLGKIDPAQTSIEYMPTNESMVTAQDIYGATPIHYAAMTTVDGLKFLLNKADKLDLIKMTDKNGMTPLHYAAMSGKEEAVELLLNKVAKDQREEFANIKAATVDTYGNQLPPDIAGKTARDLAQQAGHVNLVAYLSKKMGEKKSDDKKAWADRQQETREIQKEKARAGKTELIQEKKDKILERKTENIEKKAEQKRWDEDKKAEKLENKTKMKKINKNLEAHLQ